MTFFRNKEMVAVTGDKMRRSLEGQVEAGPWRPCSRFSITEEQWKATGMFPSVGNTVRDVWLVWKIYPSGRNDKEVEIIRMREEKPVEELLPSTGKRRFPRLRGRDGVSMEWMINDIF
jgi:hypothetical protein